MGGDTTTVQSQQAQTSQATATPEEEERNRLALERERAAQPGLLQTQGSGLNLINQLLTGGQLPGALQPLTGGISEETIGRTVQGALGDVQAGLQRSGLLDSGVRAELETETAADIRAQAEQFNIQNLMQLLGLGIGGQGQVQAPLLAQSGQLGQQLAGLRSVSTTGTGTQATAGMNPFLRSFQTSLGQSLGSGKFGGAEAFPVPA